MFRIALGHVSPNPVSRKKKQYSPTSLTNAYLDVVEKKLSVHKAAKLYGVPDQTLRDRVTGRINADTVTYGRGPLFDLEEEARLVQHIRDIAAVGYGYTRSEVVNLASEYAVMLGKRDKDSSLTARWFYGLLSRWPELKVQRAKSLSELRYKASSSENIANYFHELGRILDKYNLKDKSQNIYNVDEKGIQQNFRPTHIVSSAAFVPSVVTSERSSTTTILGCGNAFGYQIPPYFVFAGARMRDELLEGCCIGAQGTVSKSGWSNSTVFLDYLQNHFIKYAKPSSDDTILLLYDGHRSHISPYLVDWAADNNIVLFVLPPHTSHILQPMDVGCFGAFAKMYSDECQKHQRSTGSVINRYNICSVSCKAYTKALSTVNLQSAFRKSGIFPYDPSVIDVSVFAAEQTRNDFQMDQSAEPQSTVECTDLSPAPESPLHTIDHAVNRACTTDHLQTTAPEKSSDDVRPEVPVSTMLFFKRKRPVFTPPILKSRRSVSKVVAGKAITEPEVTKQLKDYYAESRPKCKKAKFHPPIRCSQSSQTSTCSTTKKQINPGCKIPVAGPSGAQIRPVLVDSEEPESVEDSDLCCVCGKFTPDAMRRDRNLAFAKWGKCEFHSCTHWVHLKYCCPFPVLRRHDSFFCPCHGLPWKGSEE